MPSFKDQMGRTVLLDKTPRRIVSLVPSQTELLSALGLQDQVKGITKFCVHPEQWFRTKARVGGTKTIDPRKIFALDPDLVIANKEENVKEQIEALESRVPVWVSDVNTLQEACDMMLGIGEITGRMEQALELTGKILHGFNRLQTPGHIFPVTPMRCAYLIWKNPYITVGGDTFINDMLQYCHLENVFSTSARYPQISLQDLIAANCQVILLSSEPYPFKQKHIKELQTALPSARILLVDGEIFSWYGSRLLKAPEYFLQLRQLLKTGV